MILYDTCLYGEKPGRHIQLSNGIISSIRAETTGDEVTFNLRGATVLPGFINSHDHLDFNCYPRLGNGIYPSYRNWGPDIRSVYADKIQQVQSIPSELRIKWGLYKNLLNGFTTVVNHGPRLLLPEELLYIHQDCTSLHSPGFEKNWKWKLNNPLATSPVVMHLGEGTDQLASDEIDQVINFNFFRKNMIAIHGVSMKEEHASFFKGLVWCPSSNYFFLAGTAPVERLRKKIPLVFGTDSTLTAHWRLKDHFSIARNHITEAELLDMLTITPSHLWKLKNRGSIQPGMAADLLIVRSGKSLFDLVPEDILLVIQNGCIRMIDESLITENLLTGIYTRISFNDVVKRVKGDLSGLVKNLLNYFPALEIPFTILHEN